MGVLDTETRPESFDGLPLFAWGVDRALLDPAFVESLRRDGREIWTWTIKTLGHMKAAVALGVDGLITDIPGSVTAALP
jgi:glycerophosphoryl diester phosphodiesterase